MTESLLIIGSLLFFGVWVLASTRCKPIEHIPLGILFAVSVGLTCGTLGWQYGKHYVSFYGGQPLSSALHEASELLEKGENQRVIDAFATFHESFSAADEEDLSIAAWELLYDLKEKTESAPSTIEKKLSPEQ